MDERIIVDDIFKPLLSFYSWHIDDDGYACTDIGHRRIYLHRFLLGIKDDRYVDHINRNRLDNRLENLRIVTQAENNQNVSVHRNSKSGYRGVYYINKSGKYRAMYAKKIIGYFNTAEEANVAAIEWRKIHMPFSQENK